MKLGVCLSLLPTVPAYARHLCLLPLLSSSSCLSYSYSLWELLPLCACRTYRCHSSLGMYVRTCHSLSSGTTLYPDLHVNEVNVPISMAQAMSKSQWYVGEPQCGFRHDTGLPTVTGLWLWLWAILRWQPMQCRGIVLRGQRICI